MGGGGGGGWGGEGGRTLFRWRARRVSSCLSSSALAAFCAAVSFGFLSASSSLSPPTADCAGRRRRCLGSLTSQDVVAGCDPRMSFRDVIISAL